MAMYIDPTRRRHRGQENTHYRILHEMTEIDSSRHQLFVSLRTSPQRIRTYNKRIQSQTFSLEHELETLSMDLL